MRCALTRVGVVCCALLGAMSAVSEAGLCEPGVSDSLTGDGYDVAVRGDRTYLASSPGGMHVYDVSGGAPVYLRGFDRAYSKILVDGAYAYAMLGTTLDVLDVSDPDSESVVASLELSANSSRFVLRDGTLYIASVDVGLQVVDVSNPLAPSVLAGAPFAFFGRDIALAGDVALVVDDADNSLVLIDITDPAAPSSISTQFVEDDVFFVAASGSTAYVATADTGGGALIAMDLTDPENPVSGDAVPLPQPPSAITADGAQTVYVGVHDGRNGDVLCFDVSEPLAPEQTGTVGVDGRIRRIRLHGDTLCAVGMRHALTTIDVTDPAAPQPLGATALPYDTLAVSVAGDRVFVGDQWLSGGLQELGLSETTGLIPRGKALSNHVSGIAVVGGYAYTAASYGMGVFDVSVPGAPEHVGFEETTSQKLQIAARGDYVYLAGGSVSVFDISDPANPFLAHSISRPGETAEGLFIDGDLLYVAIDIFGLRIYDISDPLHPVSIGRVDSSDKGISVFATGGYAYLADWRDGLTIVDVNDPTAPVVVGGIDTPGRAVRVVVRDGVAYVADRTGGVRIIDVSDPSAPFNAGVIETQGEAYEVQLFDDTLLIACEKGGLQLVDISVCSRAADLDGDGVVDSADLATLLAAWSSAGSDADLNADGVVDSGDLAILLAAWD